MVVGAGATGSAAEALREWQVLGPSASGATLSPSPPGTAALLLEPCLQTGPLSDQMQGSEPRELMREYYRLRRRARVLAAVRSADPPSPDPSGGTSGAFDTRSADNAGQLRDAFLAWYATRHDVNPQAEDAGTIIQEWGPWQLPDDTWFYACSPHRIEMTATLIRDGYLAEHANAALRLLPEWTQWCIEQSGLTRDLAARSRMPRSPRPPRSSTRRRTREPGRATANRSPPGVSACRRGNAMASPIGRALQHAAAYLTWHLGTALGPAAPWAQRLDASAPECP